MPARTFLLSLLSFAALSGCSKHESPTPATQSQKITDACALVSSGEIEAVQGEAVVERKPSERSADGLRTGQCYFALPSAANSIVLSVTEKAQNVDGREPREYWTRTFHPVAPMARETNEPEKAPPTPVEGIGEEAFWSENAAALYVLSGNAFLRIGVGGAGDRAIKLEKSKAIARSALKRL